ncbi:MAG TPA: winged helix DNA-binding domain-containing protein [Nocardioides sp.]|uniref:winged helix DNA-binding domain-containing protein n=1 Tax=Nocardioides sp. TaxID=35761 RepID=UPI002D810114|nr:winged helix DNA-binding domain-containing protein [Nocardioides sp.]HET6654428.1 winged helix DNA-binding domain-containing protein [Nocardioides sp.]
MTTDRDIARWRLRTQHLVSPHAGSAAEVVRSLLAVQAENPSQAAWAVASRTRDREAADLEALLDEGSVVRTHVLRPTWHFVAAEDIGWLLELTAPRVRPAIARALEEGYGLAGATLDHASSAVLQALSEQPDQTREQLGDRLRERGVEPRGQLLMFLLALMELDRLICSGRRLDGVHTYAGFADRVPSSRRLDRDEALAELALRYFTGHGPATERDLAYWATLTLGDVRRGLAEVRDRLASFEHDGRTFWHAPGSPPSARPGDPAGHLLQILDEVYRGYQDSRMVLDSEGIVPGGRETAIGMALVDAQMVARMKRTIGRRVVFEVTAYNGPLSPSDRAVVEQAAERYADFLGLGLEHELRVR